MNFDDFKFVIALVLVLAFAPISGGCAKPRTPEETAPGKILVKVNDGVITDEELLTEYANLPEFAQEEYAGEAGLRKFLDELVTRELLYQKALQERLEEDADFRLALLSYRKARLSAMLIEREGRGAEAVTEGMVKQYFDENQEDFQLPEKIQVAHILTRSKEEADEVYNAVNKGASFARVAREKSIDPETAERGGELTAFSRGSMAPEFEAVAFNLKLNEVSRPVKTESGYHVIKLLDRYEAQQVDYDRISDFIKSRMEDEIRQQAFESLSETLKKTASISDIDEKAFNALLEKVVSNKTAP